MAAPKRASPLVLAWPLVQLLALAHARAAEGTPAALAEPKEAQQDLCQEEGDSEELATLQLVRRTGAAQSGLTRHGDHSVPVFVMMSLTMVTNEGVLSNPAELRRNLRKLKHAGVTGVMTDCWWGITEPEPKVYRFDAYKSFVKIAKQVGLNVQFVTSFHQCGEPSGAGQPGSCYIPLPHWVHEQVGIWFKNTLGNETKAYISLFADHVEVGDRTPIDMYRDWIRAFNKEFSCDFGGTIVEVMVGLGTDGELKYPSYQNGPWSFPGIGMPQASDQYARASLKAAAAKQADSKTWWGRPPPAKQTGDNNAFPQDTPFYRKNGGYTRSRGKFFLEWYSKALIQHAHEVLQVAREELGRKVKMSGKIAGVHWFYRYPSHAAEANAGYYNSNGVDGYKLIADAFKPTNTLVDFTCLEMTDASQPKNCDCSPQELVFQVQSASRNAGLPFTGENALGFYDKGGYNQMMVWKPPNGYVSSITYLRISDELLGRKNLKTLAEFCEKMSDPGWVTPFSIESR